MTFETGFIKSLPVEQFRRLGIALCYRLGCDRKDKRLAKALKRLEQSLGPPADEQMRRDALNAARSVYREAFAGNMAIKDTACTLVCACADGPNPNLIGNFASALSKEEGLSRDEIKAIGNALLGEVLNGKP